jgi:hypothetical protein
MYGNAIVPQVAIQLFKCVQKLHSRMYGK